MTDNPTGKYAFKYTATAAQWVLPGEPVLLQGPLEYQFKAAAELGYDALEMHLRKPEDASVQEILSLTDKYGVRVSGVATGLAKRADGFCLIDPDPAQRRGAVDRLLSFVDWAGALNAYIIIGSMRGNLPKDETRPQAEAWIREGLSEVLKAAEEKKVNINLEVINRYENNYLNTAAETKAFVESFGSPSLKVHLDLFHMNIEEADMCGAIRTAGSDLGLIHFADNNRHACGEGCLDFAAVLNTLREIGYKGYISVEHLCIPDGYTAAKNTIEYLRRIDK